MTASIATPTNMQAVPDIQIGQGADTFIFSISEDAWQGDAQFTITIDAIRQGGIQTTTASHAAGQEQTFQVNGNFGAPGQHTATIDFLNDAYGGSAATDRNLYVNSMSFDGAQVPITPAALLSSGPMDFVRYGSHQPDTLVLAMSEDAWNGDAQAEISMDGRVIATTNVMALNSAGAFGQYTYGGQFGSGAHTLGIRFINDGCGGSPDTDRNLYVRGVTFNGVSYPSDTADMYSNGLVTFDIPAHV